MASTTSRARSFSRSGDCSSNKEFAFRTPNGIFMYAPMRRPLLPRLAIGDIADHEAARAGLSAFREFGLVASCFECSRQHCCRRLAHADRGDDGCEQSKDGKGVESAAEASGGILEPADDRWAGAAAQDADRIDPGDAARQSWPRQKHRRQWKQMGIRGV